MILLEDEPTLTDLHALINKVPAYPVSIQQILQLAQRQKMPQPVINFYNAFPKDEVFNDKDDLLATTEGVEMLHHQDAPMEVMHTPEED